MGLTKNPQNQNTQPHILPELKMHPTRILPKFEYVRPIFSPTIQTNKSTFKYLWSVFEEFHLFMALY